jgi:hypothetical protein
VSFRYFHDLSDAYRVIVCPHKSYYEKDRRSDTLPSSDYLWRGVITDIRQSTKGIVCFLVHPKPCGKIIFAISYFEVWVKLDWFCRSWDLEDLYVLCFDLCISRSQDESTGAGQSRI